MTVIYAFGIGLRELAYPNIELHILKIFFK
jgi:hypothetical protein